MLLCVGPPLFSTEPSSDQLTSTCCNVMIGGVNWLMILFEEGGGWSITFMKTSWLHLVDRAKLDFFPPILTIKCKYKCQWYWFLSWSQRNVCIFSSWFHLYFMNISSIFMDTITMLQNWIILSEREVDRVIIVYCSIAFSDSPKLKA